MTARGLLVALAVAFLFVATSAQWTQHTWTLGFGNNNLNTLAQYGAYNPGSRGGAYTAVTKDAANNSVLRMFGGYGLGFVAGQGSLCDMWKWKYTQRQWEWYADQNTNWPNLPAKYGPVDGQLSSSSWPGGRSSGATWTDVNGSMWIFGGWGLTLQSNVLGMISEVWKWDEPSLTWGFMSGARTLAERRRLTTNPTPGARYWSSHAQDNAGNFYLIGGVGVSDTSSDPDGNPIVDVFNDVWKYSTSTRSWILVHPGNQLPYYGTKGLASSLNVPPPHSLASATYRNGSIYLFGGVFNGDILDGNVTNTLWQFDLSTNYWTWLAGDQIGDKGGVFPPSSLYKRTKMTTTSTLNLETFMGPDTPPADVPADAPIDAPVVSPVDPPSSPSAPVTAPAAPTAAPTAAPVADPTAAPVAEPIIEPVMAPIAEPTNPPESAPVAPVAEPTSAPTATPTDAPATAPTTPPIASPVAEPTTSAPVDAPTTTPISSAPTTPPTSPLVLNPGGRAGSRLIYVPLEDKLYLSAGLGLDGNTVLANLNDLWSYDFTSNTWSWVNGNATAPYTIVYGAVGQIGNPNGRWDHNVFLDPYSNIWITNGYYNYDDNRNDAWSWSLITPPPFSPNSPPPVLPPPPSAAPVTSTPQGQFNPIDPNDCSTAIPANNFKCVGDNTWVYGGNFIAPDDDWTIDGNVTVIIYGDLVISSQTNLVIEYGSRIQVTGTLDFYGSLTLQIPYWGLNYLGKFTDDSLLRTLRLITHHENPPAKRDDMDSTASSNSKKTASSAPPMMRSSRAIKVSIEMPGKRDSLAINDPIDQGDPIVTGSSCATFSYYLTDDWIAQDIYQVSANVYNIRYRCNQYWWAWLILGLVIALVLVVIATLLILHFVFKKEIFGGFSPMSANNDDPAHSKTPAALRPGVDPVIDMSEIDISAADGDMDHYEESEEEEEEEEEERDEEAESSVMEGSEEASEEISEEEDEEDEDHEELTDEESE